MSVVVHQPGANDRPIGVDDVGTGLPHRSVGPRIVTVGEDVHGAVADDDSFAVESVGERRAVQAGFFHPTIDADEADQAVPAGEVDARGAFDGHGSARVGGDDGGKRWEKFVGVGDASPLVAAGGVDDNGVGGAGDGCGVPGVGDMETPDRLGFIRSVRGGKGGAEVVAGHDDS